MSEVKWIQRLHQHRAWVNTNLQATAALLEEAQLKQPFEIGQGSVWKTLLHLYAAEYVWLAALQGEEDPLVAGDLPGKIPGNQQGEGGIQSFADLQAKWQALESRWQTYLKTVRATDLEEVVYKKSSGPGPASRKGTRRGDVLLHVCTHAHYTTAQVMNMLRQLGVQKLPDVMLISLARSEGLSEA